MGRRKTWPHRYAKYLDPDREEVLAMNRAGVRSSQIAARFKVSPNTVRRYLREMQDLGLL